MNTHTSDLILQMHNIHVNYDGIEALKGVDFNLRQGEIHALVGEHRAGKSSLVKLLSGAVFKTEGEIRYKGKEFDLFTPKTAMKNKIGMVYQDLSIIPSMNTVENIFAGQMVRTWYGALKQSTMLEITNTILKRLDVHVNPQVPLEKLSQVEQHIVELARVLSIDPDILILDEVSGRFTPEEMEGIYKLILELKAHGKSIIYISHNMDEIFEFADRVTILKDGYRRGTEEVKDLDKVRLIKLTYSFMLSREELNQDNRELYYFKKYNENIIKNLPVGVIILDIDHKIHLLNYAAIKILELENRDIAHQDMRAIFHSGAIDQAEEILEKIETNVEYTWDELNYKLDKILKVNIFPFKDEDYKSLGTIVLIEDVSKDCYFKDYLLRTEKIASVAELAAGVAHEINNPLSIILNYVNLLKRKKLDSDGVEKLKQVEDELNRIVRVVKSLLSFSKLKRLPMKKMNLVNVLNDVVLLIDHKIKEKKINLMWQPNTRNVPLVGDDNILKQVFLNLLINSVEAVLEDGVIEMTLDVQENEGYVIVSIRDNGYGIPPDIIDRIFDPFFSTKVNKSNTGLGLAICQHIIEMHQGLMTCTSAEGVTTFNVRLPM